MKMIDPANMAAPKLIVRKRTALTLPRDLTLSKDSRDIMTPLGFSALGKEV
jgi:hypothetical protein